MSLHATVLAPIFQLQLERRHYVPAPYHVPRGDRVAAALDEEVSNDSILDLLEDVQVSDPAVEKNPNARKQPLTAL